MTPEAKQLLKDKLELCKEIAFGFTKLWFENPGTKESIWPEFLKEHTKPDWEILSFRSDDGSPFVLKENGKYGTGWASKLGLIKIEHLLYGGCSVEDGLLSIHSVRRSDGEVFEERGHTAQGRIIRFFIDCDNRMTVDCEGKDGIGVYALNTLTKLQPLFKTEDGVDVYKGDSSIAVDKDTLKILDATEYNGQCSSFKYFSTREAAEAWVEDHKPRYSIADLKKRGLHI